MLDPKKLEWMNGQHLSRVPLADLDSLHTALLSQERGVPSLTRYLGVPGGQVAVQFRTRAASPIRTTTASAVYSLGGPSPKKFWT